MPFNPATDRGFGALGALPSSALTAAEVAERPCPAQTIFLVADATGLGAGATRRIDASDLALRVARWLDDVVGPVRADELTFFEHEAVSEFLGVKPHGRVSAAGALLAVLILAAFENVRARFFDRLGAVIVQAVLGERALEEPVRDFLVARAALSACASWPTSRTRRARAPSPARASTRVCISASFTARRRSSSRPRS